MMKEWEKKWIETTPLNFINSACECYWFNLDSFEKKIKESDDKDGKIWMNEDLKKQFKHYLEMLVENISNKYNLKSHEKFESLLNDVLFEE